VFNIQPGQGLGFTGSKEIALGLGGYAIVVVIVPEEAPISRPGAGAVPGAIRRREEKEIQEIMVIILRAGILD
jgi:hypothetical protein